MLLDGARLAVGTLSAIAVPAPVRVDRRVAGLAMTVAPFAVVPIAALTAVVAGIGDQVGLPAAVTAALSIGVLAMGSRGIHLDGLSDTADGLSASYDRQRSLEVMSRGNTGPMGVATLVVVLLVQILAAAAVLSRPWGWVALGLLACCARSALLLCCVVGVPSARPSGLGAMVAGTVPRAAAVIGALLAVAAVSGAALVCGQPWWQGLAAALAGFAVVAVLVTRCVRRFGGITGDVIGAAVELMFAAMLLVASARG